ncbi:Gmad2 immunoglobulin-like domain-containing protein [Candidatus Falkowbacteria bacterium]|nr:Gmad2 immunoglobulin-like domain-containing protein [Candidatus Falkowbacteria bacterium]
MKKVVISLIIMIIFALAGYAFYQWQSNNASGNIASDGLTNNQNKENNSDDVLVRIENPKINTIITSPLKITGEAFGNWYFEASFPVQLRDETGQLLAQGIAQAKSDWMVADYVPFELTLTFSTPSTKTGLLIFIKDNPSGLPELDQKIELPVKFSQ